MYNDNEECMKLTDAALQAVRHLDFIDVHIDPMQFQSVIMECWRAL